MCRSLHKHLPDVATIWPPHLLRYLCNRNRLHIKEYRLDTAYFLSTFLRPERSRALCGVVEGRFSLNLYFPVTYASSTFDHRTVSLRSARRLTRIGLPHHDRILMTFLLRHNSFHTFHLFRQRIILRQLQVVNFLIQPAALE